MASLKRSHVANLSVNSGILLKNSIISDFYRMMTRITEVVFSDTILTK